jgi:serine/threonine protein kinase
MTALGAAGIIHRDLAARNILIDELRRVKIGDFGLSRESSDGDDRIYYQVKTQRPLPLRWTAPEVVTKLSYSVRSDVYAYGVFSFEVYSFGLFPFDTIQNDQTFLNLLGATNIAGGTIHPSLAIDLPLLKLVDAPEVVTTLISACLLRDSTARPSFAQIVNQTRPGGGTTGRPAGGMAGRPGAPTIVEPSVMVHTRTSVYLGFDDDGGEGNAAAVEGATETSEL